MMTAETKACQNCKSQFAIEADDFEFYKKIDVSLPTFCPDCRLIRRLAWRNERTLHKRICDLCKKDIIAMYPTDAPFPVYCHDCWNSDRWDPLSYAQEYDFSKPFLEQYEGLMRKVPRMNLWQLNASNSTFTNLTRNCKDVYLSYSLVGGEQIYYSKIIDGKSYRLFDCLSTADSENCYETIYGLKNYNSRFLFESQSCIDAVFLYDCVNCKNCFMSANLRNKEFVFRNEQLTEEEYKAKLQNESLDSHEGLEDLKLEFRGMISKSLHKYADITKSTNASGDHIVNAKNAAHCFDVHDVEDVKYCFRILNDKDTRDASFFGGPGELSYEYISGGNVTRNMAFCMSAVGPLRDIRYSDLCGSVSNLFGCIALRNEEYCILNKKYSREEYETLLPKIRQQMDDMPYSGRKGRAYRYGEFFPIELSPFAYNETIAQEYFPLSPEEAREKGYAWKEPDKKEYKSTIHHAELPDKIGDVTEGILKETITCKHDGKCHHQCTTAFRVVEAELQFYRQFVIPVPHLCPNCRHYERLAQIRPMKLWERGCSCRGARSRSETWPNSTVHFHGEEPCPNHFETPYDPAGSEIVYCEQCYQAEVA